MKSYKKDRLTYRGELNSATLIFSLGFNPHNLFGTCHIKRPPNSATLLTIYKENHATQPYLLKKRTFNAALNMSIIKPCGVLLPDGIKPIPVIHFMGKRPIQFGNSPSRAFFSSSFIK